MTDPDDRTPDPWKPIGPLAQALVRKAEERRQERERAAKPPPTKEDRDA